MDEIQHTYKLCKLVLFLSIHEQRDILLKLNKLKNKGVKTETKTFKLVCVYLSISKVNYPYTILN